MFCCYVLPAHVVALSCYDFAHDGKNNPNLFLRLLHLCLLFFCLDSLLLKAIVCALYVLYAMHLSNIIILWHVKYAS